ARAMDLDADALGLDLLSDSSPVRLLPGTHEGEVLAGPRVGVSQGSATPWRFWIAGEPTVSPYRAAVRRVRR
ncbi:MAG: 3-methyladenine glycosylase, partial [Frankiales bacterium]|nr:3-methyladenine glycosylase [Frankiales bacterium]